jgi:LacI family transcriptional regulator
MLLFNALHVTGEANLFRMAVEQMRKVLLLPSKARMQDVAKLAGVASMTVSRVLNNSGPVTQETRQRVHQAIKTLNYRPNPFARSLRREKSNSIGIIVPNFYDPFFANCAHAISMVAKKHHFSVSVATSEEDSRIEFTEASLMASNRVAGIAVIPAAMGKSRLNRPEFHATQIVTLDRPIQGHRFNSVLVENEQGSAAAVKHLIGHGFKKIVYLGLSERLYTINARYQGYRTAMLQAGLAPDQSFICSSQEETLAAIRKTMASRRTPTAFFMSNNLVTRHALHALSQLNLSIPDDVAVVGFDDFEMADIFNPAITVVRQPALELGNVAAELLFSRIQDKNGPENGQQIVLPVDMIVRQSCGCNPRSATPTSTLRMNQVETY